MSRWFSIVPFRQYVAVMFAITLFVTLMTWYMAATLAPDDPAIGWVVGLIVIGVLVVVMFPLGYLLLRPLAYMMDIRRMLAGECWVHWEYNEVDWASACQVDGLRVRKRYTWESILLGGGAVTAVIALGAGNVVVTVFGGLLATMGLTNMSVKLLSDVPRFARRAARGEVYISPFGVYRVPGGYLPLVGLNYKVCDVHLYEARPPIVRFDVRVVKRQQASRSNWETRTSVSVVPQADILTPTGHDDEARSLVDKFNEAIHS